MGFFDDLGKKMSDAGQSAVQKTKEMSDIARLNSSISQNESKINSLYVQIGKLYTEKYGIEGEDEFSGLVKEIKESEDQIVEYKKQIEEIKGVKRCPNCGAEVPKDAAFCSSCGAAMPKVEEPISEDMVKCTKCGALVKKGMRFCTSCGQPIQIPIAEAEDSDATEGEEETAIEPAAKKCPSCGAEMEGDADFCSECGTKL